ncbi:MAG: 5'-3' exonuclease H3TH domain-containing protein [Acidobacteriota bacterium]
MNSSSSSPEKVQVHLVDGTYELFRSYFGAPKRATSDGREVAATRTLARSLLKLLEEPGVTHVACAFDTVIRSFRNDIFPGYKTGEGVDEELLSQFPLAERAAAAVGVVVWPMEEFEADDALATAAHRFDQDPAVERVVLCSPDKDLAQCVRGQRVVCWDRRRDLVYDDAGVEEKFGISPRSIPDYLALVGDSADGIPGLPGWGAKSSSTALARFQHLEEIPASYDDWQLKVRGGAKLAVTLAQRQEDALLYRRLATLRVDVPLDETLEDLEWRGAHRQALETLAEELEDPYLATRPARFAD